ncbi:hypothetical protein BV25DRAFT_356466 [Artomyces pyxidatus]|uniref:Uncharacterized protein n=1 Tax=Artomyces pyxidatus TaxID=48021 RepID=A0ACB8T5H5_9AGAM|nr:hypothetical protein BV25DRAFT_356466 [Artomyces pyxidatus]
MTDKDVDPTSSMWPSRENIIREIKRLVEGAKSGDHFFFHYAGHSGQKDAKTDKKEVDGLDEYIVACDLEIILDDDLRILLVDPLPSGTRLTAVLDACHSGTLLDLDHYGCNWFIKRRHSFHGMPSDGIVVKTQPKKHKSLDVRLYNLSRGRKLLRSRLASVVNMAWAMVRMRSMVKKSKAAQDEMDVDAGGEVPHVSRCHGKYCAFFVRSGPTVISISACADHQSTWETPHREQGLTSVLCRVLEKNPEMSVDGVGKEVWGKLQDAALQRLWEVMGIRNKSDVNPDHIKRAEQLGLFVFGPQDPVIGSLNRLRMNEVFLHKRQ